MFQRQRVDMLLGELIKKFPLPVPPQPKITPAASIKVENGTAEIKTEIKTENTQDKIKPPPDKKPRLG